MTTGAARLAGQGDRSPALALLASAWRRSGLAEADRPILVIFVVMFIGAWISRCIIAPDLPLWLDETWTGAIAGQPTWRATIEQIRLDANAPLYYLVMHAWTGLFGLSNGALRMPSMLFSLATPLLILASRVEGLRLDDRLALAALVTVWLEGLIQSSEARCYTLLTLLATAQLLAFARLMAAPTTRRAAIWAGLGSLVILTHYQAIMLGAVEGFIYLAVHHVRAIRTWPAALAYAPAFAVLAWHWPVLVQFARPEVAWYPLVTTSTLEAVAPFVASSWWLYPLPGAGLLFMAWRAFRRRPMQGGPLHLWLAAIGALISLCIVVGVGWFRPSFTIRYVTAFMPGVMLLLVLGARALQPAFPGAVSGLMLMAAMHSAQWSTDVAGRLRNPYTYEAASRDLLATRPTRLVFSWDHPAQQVETPGQYAEVGGFFFRRAGSPARVTAVMLKPQQDPSQALLDQAREPGAVILWLYDTQVRNTLAASYPPRITELDPSFGCRNYGRGRIGVLACARSWRR